MTVTVVLIIAVFLPLMLTDMPCKNVYITAVKRIGKPAKVKFVRLVMLSDVVTA